MNTKLVVTNENQLWNINITYHILKDNLKSYQFTIKDNQSIECFFGWLKNTLVPRKTKLTFDEIKLKIESRIFTHNYINLNKDKQTRSTWGDDSLSILIESKIQKFKNIVIFIHS